MLGFAQCFADSSRSLPTEPRVHDEERNDNCDEPPSGLLRSDPDSPMNFPMPFASMQRPVRSPVDLPPQKSTFAEASRKQGVKKHLLSWPGQWCCRESLRANSGGRLIVRNWIERATCCLEPVWRWEASTRTVPSRYWIDLIHFWKRGEESRRASCRMKSTQKPVPPRSEFFVASRCFSSSRRGIAKSS